MTGSGGMKGFIIDGTATAAGTDGESKAGREAKSRVGSDGFLGLKKKALGKPANREKR